MIFTSYTAHKIDIIAGRFGCILQNAAAPQQTLKVRNVGIGNRCVRASFHRIAILSQKVHLINNQ